ncbi:hypothetical protein [Brevibacillus migulae]|uniref:hypothetical protein n=1 Tax=Brevibacillus migulae TaxID=1644114 RepID=UPI00106E79F3|nr:hypothetical protein [Brevibacillus migulae]
MWETYLKKMLKEQAETVENMPSIWEQIQTKVTRQSVKKHGKARGKLVLTIITCSMLLISGGVYATQQYYYWKVPRNAEEVKKSEELHQMLTEKKLSSDESIAETFHLNLTNYNSIDVNGLFKSDSYDPLVDVVSNIMDRQQVNDRKPSVYIHKQNQNEGLILEERVNAYVVHFIERANEEWRVKENKIITK